MKDAYLFARDIYRRIVPERARQIVWRLKCKMFNGIYFFNLETRREFEQYYNSPDMLPTDYPKTVIYMADGRAFSGGLADRLRGIVSAYKLCKELNIAFKIHFISPFVLKDFLQPNSYDWSILPSEICYNPKQAKPCFIYTAGSSFTVKQQMFWAKNFFKKNHKQIHVYTNMIIAGKEYGSLFYELFKPVFALESLIRYNLNHINSVLECKTYGGGGIYRICLGSIPLS